MTLHVDLCDQRLYCIKSQLNPREIYFLGAGTLYGKSAVLLKTDVFRDETPYGLKEFNNVLHEPAETLGSYAGNGNLLPGYTRSQNSKNLH
jgi:hypothetical protein